mmetsp:Transcript_57542/g.65648  ORF Transcript_57542/g.65648 Transcript_57542/m.65648 type:complete len:198 (+) Transcript_57542:107-700(+)
MRAIVNRSHNMRKAAGSQGLAGRLSIRESLEQRSPPNRCNLSIPNGAVSSEDSTQASTDPKNLSSNSKYPKFFQLPDLKSCEKNEKISETSFHILDRNYEFMPWKRAVWGSFMSLVGTNVENFMLSPTLVNPMTLFHYIDSEEISHKFAGIVAFDAHLAMMECNQKYQVYYSNVLAEYATFESAYSKFVGKLVPQTS